MFEKVKKIGKRCKAVVMAAAVAVGGAVSSVCASGTQMTAQFGVLVSTLIPVIIGILTAGLVIFGIMQLIKLAKKTFSKVAGQYSPRRFGSPEPPFLYKSTV